MNPRATTSQTVSAPQRTPARGASSHHAPGHRAGGALTGTGIMLRFMLRRDRIRLPAWLLGIAALMAYFAGAIATMMDDEGLASFAAFASNPVMGLIGGPGFGFDDITVPRFLVGMYGVFIMLGAAFMSITTVSRHTRVEEQTGRAELVRANVLGRHAQLTAALVLTATMNVLLAALVSLAFITSAAAPEPASAAFLFGCSVGAVGLVFAGVAAVTVQLSPFSRAGSGIAGAVLGVSFAVRGLGDMSAVQGGDLDWLSWLSPLGWAQQTAPFTLDRWWSLIIALAAAVLLTVLSFLLQSRRDLAAGILPDRLGSAVAPAWLRGPLALAFRLQRSSLAGWSAAMILAGVAFGAFTRPMAEGASGMPEEIVDLMGGADGIVEGYLGFMGVYFALMVGVYAILSVQSLRAEEQGMRTEAVLAASVGRNAWLHSWTLVSGVGALWLLALAGLGMGVGAAVGEGDWDMLGPALIGHVAHAPAVWALLAFAIALYGVSPRLIGLGWAVFIYGAMLSMFGEMMDLDESVLDTSVFHHIGEYPAEDISWPAVGGLCGISVVLVAIGTVCFRRRDLTTA